MFLLSSLQKALKQLEYIAQGFEIEVGSDIMLFSKVLFYKTMPGEFWCIFGEINKGTERCCLFNSVGNLKKVFKSNWDSNGQVEYIEITNKTINQKKKSK